MLGCAVLFAAAAVMQTAGRVAFLVESPDPAAELSAAIEAQDPLVRAAAARVITVRNVTALLPKLREAIAHETDVNAAREELRALVILGAAGEIDLAAAGRLLPAGGVDVIARAAARRADAYDFYLAHLRPLGFKPDFRFFTQALWQRGKLPVAVGARIVGAGDAAAWAALLRALRYSELAMDPNVLGAALNAPSEGIRVESVWYIVHGFAADPAQIGERVREALGAAAEEASLREAFGRELVKRMLGGERKDDPRFVEWLQTEEADALIGSETALFEYFTDREFVARKNHCDIAANDCRVPGSKPTGRQIPSADVTQPAFLLPDVLPAGLGDAMMREARCNDDWLGTARASVDDAGRVREVAIVPITMSKGCQRAVSAMMRLSLVSTDSMITPRETGSILLVHVAGEPVCLDEGPPTAIPPSAYDAGGNNVEPPTVKRKVEPRFPSVARESMGHGRYVVVQVQATISKEGCVRNVRLLRQSPFPDLNAAALIALAQWRFLPGRLHGEPVDVLFNLTINFKTP